MPYYFIRLQRRWVPRTDASISLARQVAQHFATFCGKSSTKATARHLWRERRTQSLKRTPVAGKAFAVFVSSRLCALRSSQPHKSVAYPPTMQLRGSGSAPRRVIYVHFEVLKQLLIFALLTKVLIYTN
jgi:hypothetical protein